MPDTSTADLILRELTAPKQRGVHYSPDSAASLLADHDAQVRADALEAVRQFATVNRECGVCCTHAQDQLRKLLAAASVEG